MFSVFFCLNLPFSSFQAGWNDLYALVCPAANRPAHSPLPTLPPARSPTGSLCSARTWLQVSELISRLAAIHPQLAPAPGNPCSLILIRRNHLFCFWPDGEDACLVAKLCDSLPASAHVFPSTAQNTSLSQTWPSKRRGLLLSKEIHTCIRPKRTRCRQFSKVSRSASHSIGHFCFFLFMHFFCISNIFFVFSTPSTRLSPPEPSIKPVLWRWQLHGMDGWTRFVPSRKRLVAFAPRVVFAGSIAVPSALVESGGDPWVTA